MMSVRSFVRKLLAALCLMVCVPLAALAQPAPSGQADPLGVLVAQATGAAPPAASSEAAEQPYILGPEDVVELEVLGRADFKTRAKIGSDGTILLPYVGQMQAADRTTKQLAAEVTAALEAGSYFQRPILRVEVVSFASRYVTVLGAVGSPGLVPINRAYRLSEILARVGGISAASADYVVVRPEQGPEHRYSIKALTTGELSQDPYVAPGDKIFLPTAEIYYLSGQVRSPGQYAVAPDLTIRMAIARAGGLTELGSNKRIKINRKNKKVGKVSLDDVVQAGDVIEIGERLF
jgi:polysaccharide export outer membrane protein